MDFLKKNKKGLVFLILSIIIIPLIMYLVWYFKEEKPIDIIIIDKTVPTMNKGEHASLNWFLHSFKVVRNKSKELYSLDDYYGFFPDKDEKYIISDFEKFGIDELKKVEDGNQMIYITDAYGVYSNEWYKHKLISERSNLIYGGLTGKEIEVLKNYKEQKKLIIAEFNCIGSPTEKAIRNNFEEMFGIKWTGWVGRHFENLLENNPDIPRWLVRNYRRKHNDTWPFKKAGIAFVNENDQVEILELGKDLKNSIPVIHTNMLTAEKFGIPQEITYPYWFDILQTKNTNTPVSLYNIDVTARGDSIMSKNGILKTFPAIIEHNETDYKFYYFAGDFADNTISPHWSHFAGVPYIKSIVSSLNDGNRENFYWNFYHPLMIKIIGDYNQVINK